MCGSTTKNPAVAKKRQFLEKTAFGNIATAPQGNGTLEEREQRYSQHPNWLMHGGYLSHLILDLNFKLVMCKCGQTEVKTMDVVKTAEARLRAGEGTTTL